MSQSQSSAASTPNPASSGVTDHQQRAPMSPWATGQHQGTSWSEAHTGGGSDALDIPQALRAIQQSINHLQNNQYVNLEYISQRQHTSLHALTEIADDLTECLDLLREMRSRDDGTTQGDPAMHPAPLNIAPVLRREHAFPGSHHAMHPASRAPSLDGPGAVATTPSTRYASDAYGTQTGVVQLSHGAAGYVYPDTVSHNTSTHPYAQEQPRAPSLPPSPGLYHSQWAQSPPVSPLGPALLYHHHHHPYYTSGSQPLPQAQAQGAALDHTHTLEEIPPHAGQGQGQVATMSLPLHYDTPGGARVALYRSHVPDQPNSADLARGPAIAWSPPAPVLSELAAETPPWRRPGAFARVDSDSEDGLDDAEDWWRKLPRESDSPLGMM